MSPRLQALDSGDKAQKQQQQDLVSLRATPCLLCTESSLHGHPRTTAQRTFMPVPLATAADASGDVR